MSAIVFGIKTSATASSYVFLQQELARGLRLSQPGRVAKDAARGELLATHHDIASPACQRRSLTPSTLRRLGRAYKTPPVAAAAQSARERAPSPQREQYEMTRSPISSNRRPFTRTTAWADLLEKAEAKGAAAAVDLAAAEMAGDAAGAVRASVER